MKITGTAVIVLKAALNDSNRINTDRIHFYDIPQEDNDNLVFGVNWAAIGTVTPGEAYEFGKQLQEGSLICEAINDMKLEVVWQKDKFIIDEEFYRWCCDAFKYDIEAADCEKLREDISRMIRLIITDV